MIRLLGGALVAGAGAWLGFQAAARLKGRVLEVSALIHGLQLLRGQVCRQGQGLPQAMERIAPLAEPPARELFARCVRACGELDRTPFSVSWRELVRQLSCLSPEALAELEGLGDVLGRFDGEEQSRALGYVTDRLEEELARARDEWQRMGRVYRMLGLAGGGFLVILLL